MGSIRKRPSGKWQARYWDGSGRQHARNFARKLDAERWITSQEAARARGDWVDPGLARITVGEWAERWLQAQVQLKPSTRARYAGVLRQQVLPTWARTPLSAVTHADVAGWVAELAAGRLSARTVHKAHRVLSLVLDLAVRDGRLTRNPAAGVRLPRADNAEKRFLTAAQVRALAEASGDYRVLIYVLAYCGLRFGEAAALQVQDIDFRRRRLLVRRSATDVDGRMVVTTPKNHQRREVPTPRFVLAMLADEVAGRARDAQVFHSPGGGVLRANNYRRRSFDRAAAATGLAGLTPHELRQTAASLAVSAGPNVKAVQRMLGHASAAMTLDVYAGLFGDDMDAVADQLDAAARAADLIDVDRLWTGSQNKYGEEGASEGLLPL